MSVARFVPSVPGRVAPGYYREVSWELKQRPGDWAILAENRRTPALQSRINKGEISWFLPTDEWEVVSRKMPSGLFNVYGRYVGGYYQDGENQ